jgi:hypothetical protein
VQIGRHSEDRCGSLAAAALSNWDVRFAPESGYARRIYTMCGRSTYLLTWEQIVRLYRLTLGQPPVNTRARYNVCPTTTIDPIIANNRKRTLPKLASRSTCIRMCCQVCKKTPPRSLTLRCLRLKKSWR